MSETKLTAQQRMELLALSKKPGLWGECVPGSRDKDLEHYLSSGLIVWLGGRRGYEITQLGRDFLASSTPPPLFDQATLAVNCHDELVAALRHPLLNQLLGLVEDGADNAAWAAAQSWMDVRDAALSRASSGE